MRKELVIDLLKKYLKKDRDADANNIFEVIEDMLRYLEEEEEEEHKTNQAMIGMQYLFRELSIKV